MNFRGKVLLLLMTAEIAAGQILCGPEGNITVAGSSTVEPLAVAWAGIFDDSCSNQFTIEGGGSSAGAARVCANPDKGTPVMIGTMSRQWKETEAIVDDERDWVYNCLVGDTTRSVAQFPVAVDGITVVSQKGGAADTCISSLGGLTQDQLRWMFSNYSTAELEATGWDAGALANGDGDDATHLWSELSDKCPVAEIKIAGPDPESGTYEFFMEAILTDSANGEGFDVGRPDGFFTSADDVAIVDFIKANADAVAFLGYSYFKENEDTLSAAAIMDDEGVYVVPSMTSVADGSYNPLSRFIYMNLHIEPADLAKTLPYLAFGYSEEGDALSEDAGFLALNSVAKADVASRISALSAEYIK